ncbi:MAG: hypothetical protein C5B49_04880 [Bdellovibrio sp.]|nr:MAG: hypothetical protein C5B49_04880 [Bdellovibrio sp.]
MRARVSFSVVFIIFPIIVSFAEDSSAGSYGAMNPSASGGLHLGLSGFYYETKQSGDNFDPAVQDHRIYYDLKIGYQAPSGFYLGGVYSKYSKDYGWVYIPTRTALGVTVGYRFRGWLMDLTYYSSASLNQLTSVSDSLQGGKGWGFEGGYNWMISSHMYAGLEVSVKSFSFSTYNSGGSESPAANQGVDYVPLINLGFYF